MNQKELLMDVIEDLMLLRRKMMQMRDCGGVSHHHASKPTRAQMGVLFMLEHTGSLNLKEIAAHMQTTSSAATQLINGLVESGYIARNEEKGDRRMIALTLTESGKKKMNEMKKAHVEHLAKILSPLTNAELKQWQSIQHKIIEGLNQD